ncbi:MAG: DUF484 family protein [Pseudomonadota bacterium]
MPDQSHDHEPVGTDQPGGNSANVVDLASAQHSRLRAEASRLRATNEALIGLAKANLAAQAQTHAAVLAILEAESLSALDHKLGGRVAGALGVDAVRILIEGHQPLKSARCILGAAPGLSDMLLGEGAERLGRTDPRFADSLYGAQASRLGSQALCRFETAGHVGVLCLAAREPGAFEPEQSADLVHFLARVLERRMNPWLRAE